MVHLLRSVKWNEIKNCMQWFWFVMNHIDGAASIYKMLSGATFLGMWISKFGLEN